MMEITSNELLRRKAVSDTLMKGTSSDGAIAYYSASAVDVHFPGLSCALSVGEKRKRSEHSESWTTGNHGVGSKNNRDVERGGESVQPKISECAGLKFHDFEKHRKDANFEVGQTWAIYDKVDGMPRLYARIRKVSAPSSGLRITYLEPDPDDEREMQWFEEDLPVSVGQFRLGKNENVEDRSIFSHVIKCKEGSNIGHLTLSPRKGEIWALFKNWDINWSSDPDSHRKYEYEVVEVLSDYADGTGVSVAFLHKAKGFASVFFRMGTGEADISQILPHNLYQFSHRIPSFKMTGEADIIQIPPQSLYRFSHMIPSFKMKNVDLNGVPKIAVELDKAALPEAVEEKTVPSHLLPKPKPEALRFPRDGKVFQTGQIWSFYGVNENMPRYYCRIQKITITQGFKEPPVFKINAYRLKAAPFLENVIQWEDKKMPVGCGTFLVTKSYVTLTPGHVSDLIVPRTSMDGNYYTILPKIGEVWAIYRFWTGHLNVDELEGNSVHYGVVEVLDDGLGYKVLALEPALLSSEDEEKKTLLRAAERRLPDFDDGDGLGVIFTIPKSKMLRFSHQISSSRITKEIDGELKELYEVDSRALPVM